MKDIMGEKIIIFIIGLLLGAIIATGAFMVCTKTCHNNGDKQEVMQLPNGNQPSMNNGQSQNNQNGQSNQPPSAPSGDNNQSNQNGQPPEMPNNDNSQSNGNTQNSNA